MLSGGDDYELCFTVPADRCEALQAASVNWDCACSVIGKIETQTGLCCRLPDGALWTQSQSGYDHFA